MNHRSAWVTFSLSLTALASHALGGGHTWRVNELFSNADGTIQYVEVKEFFGGAGETATAGHAVTSNTESFTIPSNVAAPTSFRHILIATPAFVGLPGAPTPDYVLPPGSVPFFSTGGDTVRYVPYCTYTFGGGVVPTNGVHSLTLTSHEGHAFSIALSSPTNYAGQTGTINLVCMDGDGDGYGDPGDPLCPAGPETDCNDDDMNINPGESELCNDEIDNDCDLLVDCEELHCSASSACVPAITTLGLWVIAASVAAGGGWMFRKRRSG